jgi:predicted transcriptional regulator
MTGRELRKARVERGLGMRELARVAKVSVGTISAAESGKFKPRGATIRKLVAAMKKFEKLPDL